MNRLWNWIFEPSPTALNTAVTFLVYSALTLLMLFAEMLQW